MFVFMFSYVLVQDLLIWHEVNTLIKLIIIILILLIIALYILYLFLY